MTNSKVQEVSSAAPPQERSGSLLTLKRGLQALEETAKSKGTLTPKELSQRIGVNIGTAYQILRTLTECGYVERQPGSGYSLGPQVAFLGSFLVEQPLHPDIIRLLKELNDTTGESVYLSLRQGNSLRIVSAFEGTGPVRAQTLGVGFGDDLHARATGKVFLAYLNPNEIDAFLPTGPLPAKTSKTITSRRLLEQSFDSIRDAGYYMESDEYAEGVACVGAPVFGIGGKITGAIGLSRPSFTIDPEQTARLVAQVRDVSSQVSRTLGYIPGE